MTRTFAVIFFLVSLGGCASTGPVFLTEQVPADMPPTIHLSAVPFFPQKVHQCGPAATAMVLRWSGADVTADELVAMVYLPEREGSLQSDIISAVRRHGRLAYPLERPDALFKELAAGHPVIVLQNLGLNWIPRWHYAVAVGYDLPQRRIILHSGVTADRNVGVAVFHRTWRRADFWGLLVLPAGRFPADVQILPYLKAALGLERAGDLQSALKAYSAGAQRWPNHAGVQMAFGNALYTAGDLNKAREAFSAAVHVEPRNGAALNNLAHVLAELERWDEAEAAAQRAVAAGGAQRKVFQKTLQQIRQRRLSP